MSTIDEQLLAAQIEARSHFNLFAAVTRIAEEMVRRNAPGTEGHSFWDKFRLLASSAMGRCTPSKSDPVMPFDKRAHRFDQGFLNGWVDAMAGEDMNKVLSLTGNLDWMSGYREAFVVYQSQFGRKYAGAHLEASS